MNKYFGNCKNIEDVKETYRKLAKQLHPDCGGDEAEFKKMSAEYTAAFNRYKNIHRGADKTEQAAENEYAETPEMFAEIINKVINLDGIEIEIVGSWVWLSGNTYFHREAIKAAGFFFSSKHKKWYWNGCQKKSKKHSKMKFDQIQDVYGSQKVKSGFTPCFQTI